MKTTTAIYLLYCVFYCALSQLSREDKCNINFDSKNVGVFFRPWISSYVGGSAYMETDLISMIRTISTRFSIMDMPYITSKNIRDNSSLLRIPKAVAKFNLGEQATKNDSTHKPHTSMQLLVRFRVYDNGSSAEDNISFNLIKKLADEANSIFPGTIKKMAIFSYGLSLKYAQRMKNQIDYAKSVIGNGPVQYRLGIMFDVTQCENVTGWLREYIKSSPVTEPVDFLYFAVEPRKNDFKNGAEISYENLIEKFNSCKRRVNEEYVKPEVGLQTSWADTYYDGKQNFSNLIWFWEKLNNFSKSSNTPLILFDAIDLPNFSKVVQRTTGWWKLNQSIKYTKLDEFQFEEKCALVKGAEELGGDHADSEKVNKSDVEKSNVEKFIIVLVVGSLIAAILFLYWKLRKSRNAQEIREAEIAEFFEGSHSATAMLPTEDGSHREMAKIDSFAYDTKYEIDPSAFTIDESMPLGSGEFGVVCMGKIKRESLEMAVAVKVARKSVSVSLKSLMCEIKVLSYVGEHDNIVRLLGAYTAELQSGTLFLFLELCPTGSLLKYLRQNRDAKSKEDAIGYVDLTEDDNTADKVSNVIDMTIIQQWYGEILNGMLHLASKRLVHADLATRNVLLDRNRHAKICDFGLSRRLYDYSTYKKSQTEPMPWRWMSPESLRLLEFNERTDVWAFGVTIWEIFSFGDVPYPGLAWTIDFATKLEEGLRLQPPPNCPPEMYERMLRCWNIKPLSRPSFSQLAYEFVNPYDN